MKIKVYSDNVENMHYLDHAGSVPSTRINSIAGHGMKKLMSMAEEDIVGFIQYDEFIYGQCWDWRILEIFQDPKVAMVGLCNLIERENFLSMEGYWYSPEDHKPPIGISPLIWPITPTKLLGPAPFFVRKETVSRLLGRASDKINSYTAAKLSRIVNEAGFQVVATAIPFYKKNFYIAHEEVK